MKCSYNCQYKPPLYLAPFGRNFSMYALGIVSQFGGSGGRRRLEMARVRPKNSEANSEARNVPLVIKKHRLRTHIKFINTKKLHTVSLWQSQQCQCTIQKLTSIEYYNKASNNFLSEKNVT